MLQYFVTCTIVIVLTYIWLFTMFKLQYCTLSIWLRMSPWGGFPTFTYHNTQLQPWRVLIVNKLFPYSICNYTTNFVELNRLTIALLRSISQEVQCRGSAREEQFACSWRVWRVVASLHKAGVTLSTSVWLRPAQELSISSIKPFSIKLIL